MTLPLDMLANNPYKENPDNIPSWRKAQQAAEAQQTNNQSQVNSLYSATAQTNPQALQQTRLQATTQLGQDSTTSALQTAAAKQAAAAAAKQQKIIDAQNASIAELQRQATASAQAAALAAAQAAAGTPGSIPGTGTTPAAGTTSGTGTTGTTAVQYTGQAAQIAQMARNAGFTEEMVPTIVAISLAESSGRADATHHNNNGSTDFGLMQINSVHSDLLNKYDWKDPQQNMDMAFQIYQGGGGGYKGLHAWSTYNSDDYSKFLQQGIDAAKVPPPMATGGVVAHPGALPVSAQTSSGLRQHIIEKAETYIGLPYEWGGTDLSKGVDCSGLVQGVYKQFGINLPRTSYDQYGAARNATWGVRTSMNQLEPGDLVYFKYASGTVHHVAIWLGGNQILEAQMSGTRVHIRNLGPNDVPYGVHLYNLDPKQPAPTQGPGPK